MNTCNLHYLKKKTNHVHLHVSYDINIFLVKMESVSCIGCMLLYDVVIKKIKDFLQV